MKNDIKYEINKINQEVGIVVKNPRDVLPSIHFTYGKPNIKTQNGVYQVLKEWRQHKPSPAQIPMKCYRQLKQYKRRNIINEYSSLSLRNINEKCYTQPCGIKSGKHDPIKGIINNDYGNESEMALKNYYDDYFNNLDLKKRQGAIPYAYKMNNNDCSRKQTESNRKNISKLNTPQIERVRVFTKLDLPQMEKYDKIRSVVTRDLAKFKTFKQKTLEKSSST